MKSLQLLTQQIIKQWKRKYHSRSFGFTRKVALTSRLVKRWSIPKEKPNSRKITSNSYFKKFRSPLMLMVAIVSLTSVVGYRFYNHPQLVVDTISPETFIAPRNAEFVDEKTTQEKRYKKLNGDYQILEHNHKITKAIQDKIASYLDRVEQLRKIAGPFPFADVKILPLSSQTYIRESEEWEWQTILAVLEYDREVTPKAPGFWLSQKTKKELTKPIQKAISELQNYHNSVSELEFESLKLEISKARQEYIRAVAKLSQEQVTKLSREEKLMFLNLADSEWELTKKGIERASQRILTQGIPEGLPDSLIRDTIAIQVTNVVPDVTKSTAKKMLGQILQPNLTEDREAMKKAAEEAARKVEPVIVAIEKGEIIVKAGETITQEDFVLLDGFGYSNRRIKWEALALSGVIVSGAIGIFWAIERRVHPNIRCRDRLLLSLFSSSAPLLAIFGVPYTNLPALGFLVSSFYSPTLAVTQVSLLTGLVSLSQINEGAFDWWNNLISGTAGGLVAASMAGKLRSREEMALLGGAVGLTQGGFYLIINLIGAATVGTTIWHAVLERAVFCGLSGVAWSVVALGISPYLERLFDLVTPIRLAELSNPNRPLLKRLATEAPGTFQHTMFVASLAEAAARELHCNVELVRAGTLYHDIGKMHDPLGFIENQMGGPNKHDEINEPWRSAEIIKKHVSEGIVMARKYGVPKTIIDFIPEHQGTLLISYFYFQAKQKRDEKEILESDFRYDGPVPQSRETGIVMLADGCEAALRSLKDATPEAALVMVNKIFRARWQDSQLVDSGLKREELPIIAEVFVRVWQQSNHKRIAYPKAALEPQKQNK